MTAAGWLEQADKEMELVQSGLFDDEERGLLKAIGCVREACMVMSADIAGLKRVGK